MAFVIEGKWKMNQAHNRHGADADVYHPSLVRLTLLARPVVETSGRSELLHAHKPELLLVYLACRGDWVSRDELTGLFWPDSDEAGARHNLRSLLHRARRLP